MNIKKKRILVVSSTAWDDDNSFGSSYSNIFGNIDEIEIANIYCHLGKPNTKVATSFFQMSEKMLLQNLVNKKHKTGRVVFISEDLPNGSKDDTIESKEQKIFKFFQKNRFQIFMWAREFIWLIGRWKSKELNKFIDDFNPDLIFLPVYIQPHMNIIGQYVKKYSNKKMLGYISDDNYTLRQFSLNPFFWLERLVNRSFVKKAIDKCEILYVISSVQKKDYDVCFHRSCKVLYKGGDFSGITPLASTINNPINILYTGNLGAGRYKNLALIGEVLDKINQNEIKAVLTIYSQTPLNRDMRNKLLAHKSIDFRGSISQAEVLKKQNKADILIYAESFELKQRLLVRQSFSTKIVDYLHSAKCIFAIGHKDCASIDYLINNNAAIVAINKKEIELKLTSLIHSPQTIVAYGHKAWNCGSANHRIEDIQDSLIQDFNKTLKQD